MNGRVYDPVIGRFLSTDPMVSQGGNSQSLNPYAYVQNRPLTLTDPTGLVVQGNQIHPSRDPSNLGPAFQNFAAHNPGLAASIIGDASIAASTGFNGMNDPNAEIPDGLGGMIPAAWASVGNTPAAVLQGFTGANGPITAQNLVGSTLPAGATITDPTAPAEPGTVIVTGHRNGGADDLEFQNFFGIYNQVGLWADRPVAFWPSPYGQPIPFVINDPAGPMLCIECNFLVGGLGVGAAKGIGAAVWPYIQGKLPQLVVSALGAIGEIEGAGVTAGKISPGSAAGSQIEINSQDSAIQSLLDSANKPKWWTPGPDPMPPFSY
jgi:hypothetical protein